MENSKNLQYGKFRMAIFINCRFGKYEKYPICKIRKISSSTEYRMDIQFLNCQFLKPNLDFPNGKNLEIS